MPPDMSVEIILRDGRDATVTITKGILGNHRLVIRPTKGDGIVYGTFLHRLDETHLSKICDPGTVNTVLDVIDDAKRKWGA